MADTLEFELVSPARLVLAQPAEMVVVPGGDGDFGILPGHSLFLSSVRPGVIDIYNKGAVTDRIFIAGGFAEATPERCTVLADAAMPISDLKREEIEPKLKDAREDIGDMADETARRSAERRVLVLEAMLAVCRE